MSVALIWCRPLRRAADGGCGPGGAADRGRGGSVRCSSFNPWRDSAPLNGKLVAAPVGAGMVPAAPAYRGGPGRRGHRADRAGGRLVDDSALGRGGSGLIARRRCCWAGWSWSASLGPSSAERLERLEADAARANERNRLAREVHDSIGHALSLVTVQASAARKLIGRNPGFAEEALETIETTSRRAVADLDHMLGLLRQEPPRRGCYHQRPHPTWRPSAA